MRNILTLSVCLFVVGNANQLMAAEIAGLNTESDFRRTASILSWGSVHRAWTAPAIQNPGLGLDVGVETSFVFRKNLGTLGNQEAVLPQVIPVPKIWASWDLPSNFLASSSLSPGPLFDSMTTFSVGLQWAFLKDPDAAFNYSALLHYTYSNAFGDIKSHTPGMSLQVSKDMILWQPYMGLGFVSANSTIRQNLLVENVFPGPVTQATFHAYVGIRLDFLAKIYAQIDFAGDTQTAAMLISQTF